MNAALRQPARTALRSTRGYASYVPPSSLDHVERIPRSMMLKPKPESPNFYTGRPAYFDHFNTLETALSHTRQVLRTLQLLPLPAFARASLPPLQPVWRGKDNLAAILDARLTTTRYRRFLALLNQLNGYRNIAETAGCQELAERVASVLELFERDNKEAVLRRGKRKPVEFDAYGRSYTMGKRKESAARAWVIPVQIPPEDLAPAETQAEQAAPAGSASVDSAAPPPEHPKTKTDIVDESEPEIIEIPGRLVREAPPTEKMVTPELPLSLSDNGRPLTVTTTTILINNTPLNEYFPLTADRERVVRPFKIAGLLGAYNVFTLVRGGGTTGQSGAISLAIAKGLAAHAPDVEMILRKAKLLRRDPRMVERKKTGLVKARKARTWVKR